MQYADEEINQGSKQGSSMCLANGLWNGKYCIQTENFYLTSYICSYFNTAMYIGLPVIILCTVNKPTCSSYKKYKADDGYLAGHQQQLMSCEIIWCY